MDKNIIILQKEAEKSIICAANDALSMLPAFVVVHIVESVLINLRTIEQKQYSEALVSSEAQNEKGGM